MKKLVIALLAAAVFAAPAIASEVYTYEAKNGNVTFDHNMHKEKLDCAKCHEGTPAKIDVTKDYAHKDCKDCHKAMGGPTKCNDCHKK